MRTITSSNRQSGFTLLELMTVTAIMGVLMSVALPAYERYSTRARFSEAILSATPYRNAVEVAAFRNDFTNTVEIMSGANGIPPYEWGAFGGGTGPFRGVFWGTVYIFWPIDGSPLSGQSFLLQAQNVDPPIEWRVSGSCVNAGYC